MLLFFNSSAHLDNVRLARQCNAMQGRAEKPHRKTTYSLNHPFSMTDKIMGSFVMCMCSSAVSLQLHKTFLPFFRDERFWRRVSCYLRSGWFSCLLLMLRVFWDNLRGGRGLLAELVAGKEWKGEEKLGGNGGNASVDKAVLCSMK
jgi:hypothetical protein